MPVQPRPGFAPVRPAPDRFQSHRSDPTTCRAAPPGASLPLARETQARIPTPRSLRGSVYTCKSLMVIVGRGREPAPAAGGATRTSRDSRGTGTRGSGETADTRAYPKHLLLLSGSHISTGEGRKDRRRDGQSTPRSRLQASLMPWQKFVFSFTSREEDGVSGEGGGGEGEALTLSFKTCTGTAATDHPGVPGCPCLTNRWLLFGHEHPSDSEI